MFCLKQKEGITLVELLIIIGILAILIAMSFGAFLFLRRTSDLETAAQEIINNLRIARQRTISSEGASQYGIYFDNTTSPQQYILFKGGDFDSRDIPFDRTYKLPLDVEIYEIDLGGGKEIVFNRLSGEATPQGNIKLRLASDPSKALTIFIEISGKIDFISSSPPSTDNLIKDSRHTHFELGWNIQNATSLKFYFPGIPKTEIVAMADYFDVGKTEFNWQGSFSVGGTDQVFQIHTHILDSLAPPYTRLCAHRDRNSGKNDKEVIIYIVDEGIDKEIAHYLADANATVIQGAYSQSFETQ